MQEENKQFNYTYSAPTEEEKKLVESIKREYEEDSDRRKKVTALIELDKKVKVAPTAISIALGIMGTLIFGLGLTFALVWEMLTASIAVGLLGSIIIASALPVRNVLYKRNKKKYTKEILQLAEEILEE